MIKKCPINNRYPLIKLKCENNSNFDLLNIPVVNTRTHETFYNIYCYICQNQQGPNYPDMTNIMIWNVSLVCPTLFFPAMKSSVSTVLQTAIEKKCSIYYSTTYLVESCEVIDRWTINICNETGFVKSVSESARFMCESIYGNLIAKSLNFIYRNQICDLCNSDVFEEPISGCFISDKDASNADQYNCKNGNLEEQTYPFKNTYCELCNSAHVCSKRHFCEMDLNECTGFGCLNSKGRPSYRELFGTSDTSKERPVSRGMECSRSEFKDTYTVCIACLRILLREHTFLL